MNVILFPSSARARQRLRFYLNRLQATRSSYPIALSAKECRLIRQLRGCAPRDRKFIRRAVAGLHMARPRLDIGNQSAGERHE